MAETVAIADDKAWKKATATLTRRYRGVDLRADIAAAKKARAAAGAGSGSGSGSGSGG